MKLYYIHVVTVGDTSSIIRSSAIAYVASLAFFCSGWFDTVLNLKGAYAFSFCLTFYILYFSLLYSVSLKVIRGLC